MSTYQSLAEFAAKYFSKHWLFKHGFNLSPMYRRTTGKVVSVSKDLLHVRVKLPINYKNRNYVGSIFGGSMFSAVDPMPMVQLINLLGNDYVVWDKSAEIFFKIPAREDLYADFHFSLDEVADIKRQVDELGELEIVKSAELTDLGKSRVYCEVRKRLYIATKAHFKAKRAKAKSRAAAKQAA